VDTCYRSASRIAGLLSVRRGPMKTFGAQVPARVSSKKALHELIRLLWRKAAHPGIRGWQVALRSAESPWLTMQHNPPPQWSCIEQVLDRRRCDSEHEASAMNHDAAFPAFRAINIGAVILPGLRMMESGLPAEAV